MTSNIFEDLHSPASYDADFDKGWRQISEKGDNPLKCILDLLRRLYWDAVRDEMANTILAFDDYKTFVPEELLKLADEELDSEYLRELIELWDPLALSEKTKHDMCESILENVKGCGGTPAGIVAAYTPPERQNVSQDELIARALLQACAFTDYDYVQEHRRPTFPSMGPPPQIDRVYPGVYAAVQCSECRFCIRSFHFYECKNGCSDCVINRNHMKSVPGEDRQGHGLIELTPPAPFRLCCTCMESSDHPGDHLKVVYRLRKGGDEDARKFSSELDVLEDHIQGQSLLSFGSAFLDHISLGGMRRSVHSRRLFPAGNAHCALMFGPLLIENGMTINPGGALISARPLPSLGRHSPREVKEYLRPENFRTIQGCDVFCAQIYSVSPDRCVYEASKRARERRFLCARKQLSGGLFTSYNNQPRWTIGEGKLTELFLTVSMTWQTEKSPTGSEEQNRALLQKCATQLTDTMKYYFDAEIDPHLFLLAQKLGKNQKLAYSCTSNNCQDFCNGLLNYNSYTYPMFSVLYPFIPVSLSPDIEQKPEERCLSYLQSFVMPLEYPIVGSRSRRTMLGSAVALYSSYAQNDADLIDHVYSVRFGRDSDHFSLGFHLGSKIQDGDTYLLKDEEMSCSDRFAAKHNPELPQRNGPCSLADHLLDCPVDNLSILQTHLLRQVKYYVNDHGEFIVNLGPTTWMTNRLQILRRLKLLHDFLAEIAVHFQECCEMFLPPFSVVDVKALRKTWRPGYTALSRAWHLDKRVGHLLHYAPDIDFGEGEMNNYRAVGFFTLGTTFLQTHATLIDGNNVFMTRLKTLKSLLTSRLAGKEETWSPWEWCTCDDCKIYRLEYTCHQLDWNAGTNDDCLECGEAPSVVRGHPDYVSPREVEKYLYDRRYWASAIERRHRALDWAEENHKRVGSGWVSTYLLCLRLIFGAENADLQLLRRRLEYYKLQVEGK